MNFYQKILLAPIVGVVAGVMFIGCGVTTKKLDDAEKKIETLSQQGVSDSVLSDARVLIVQIKTSKRFGGGTASPQKLYDSVITIIAKAELGNSDVSGKLKPYVDSLRKTIDLRKHKLSGMQLKEADSLTARADSLIKMNRWADAKVACVELDAILTSLEKDETTAKETKAKLTGSWTGVLATKNKEEKSNYVEKKVFNFAPDGKIDIVEERNGQTNEALKEDWKYQSAGTYSLKADTIFIAVIKEKCIKQVYTNQVTKNGKTQWIKNEKKPYDSVITSGKKDRFLTFSYLKENFKKH